MQQAMGFSAKTLSAHQTVLDFHHFHLGNGIV
jgi:hypothetical protein